MWVKQYNTVYTCSFKDRWEADLSGYSSRSNLYSFWPLYLLQLWWSEPKKKTKKKRRKYNTKILWQSYV